MAKLRPAPRKGAATKSGFGITGPQSSHALLSRKAGISARLAERRSRHALCFTYPRNNEDPHFSPDGNFVVFSSNRTGQKNIYAMNVDGTFVKRLTYGMGNCVTPKWSLPPVATAPAPASVSTGQ